MRTLTVRAVTNAFVALVGFTSIAHSGQNVVVLLDDSGSMNDRMRGQSVRKIEVAKTALLTVLKKLPDDANVGVFAMNGPSEQGDWIIELGPVQKAALDAAIHPILAKGGTPLGAYMKTTADALLKLRENDRFGTYRLLIVTDGEANDAELVADYLPKIAARGLSIDVIGVDMGTDHSLANEASSYRRANDPQALEKAITEVLAENSQGYLDETDDSAFELIASLPEEICSAAIDALTENTNEPIEEANLDYAGDRGLRPRWPRGSKNNSSGPANGSIVVGLMIFLAVVVVMSVVSAAKKKTRRR